MAKEEKKEPKFVIENIATQTEIAIKDTEKNVFMNLQETLCAILNNQEEILSRIK